MTESYNGFFVRNGKDQEPDLALINYSALTICSTTFLASPNTIIVLSI